MDNPIDLAVAIYDDRRCELGEGAFWHPERNQLFWFDITAGRLLTNEHGEQKSWGFGQSVSAAGFVSYDEIIIASETGLLLFNVTSGLWRNVVDIEANNAETRSNDSRADPWGGYWISTMSKTAGAGKGGIYRYYQGEVVKIVSNLTIPNSICFDFNRNRAYYSDTARQVIYVVVLDPENGSPISEPSVFADLSTPGLNPDGAITDADGFLWVALWGSSKVIKITPQGDIVGGITVPAQQPSCPVFGGADFTEMYITSAREGLGDIASDYDGKTFIAAHRKKGVAAPKVNIAT